MAAAARRELYGSTHGERREGLWNLDKLQTRAGKCIFVQMSSPFCDGMRACRGLYARQTVAQLEAALPRS
jgi:hypothetical protein